MIQKSLVSIGATVALSLLFAVPASANSVGDILVCYACQNTGNAAIDAALAANPDVASDGILFAIENTSATAITGATFSVSNASPNDTISLPTIAANSTFILIPGRLNDGNSHPSGGFFSFTGAQPDTSDGYGGLSDASVFSFIGSFGALTVTSNTPGDPAGTFTPGNPSLLRPYREPVGGGITSFIGFGPSGDGGCINCYFGQVATLDVPNINPVPGPIVGAGLPGLVMALGGFLAWTRRRKSVVI